MGRSPTVPIRTKICVVGSLPDLITCAKFQVEFFFLIFRGYDFTGGFEFPIFEWALQQCSATALPVIISRPMIFDLDLRPLLTALLEMQTRSSDENSVCPSICQMRAL